MNISVSEAPRMSKLQQIDRVLLIVELLAPIRRGATLQEITHDVNEFLGTRYVKRTIARDLAVLAQLGLVERFRPTDRDNGHSLQQYLWRFIDRTFRATVLHRAAELRGELRDAG